MRAHCVCIGNFVSDMRVYCGDSNGVMHSKPGIDPFFAA